MKNTIKNSKYYAVNIRRGVVYLNEFKTAREIKELNQKDVLPF